MTKFDKKQWEERGAIVDAGGGARYMGLIVGTLDPSRLPDPLLLIKQNEGLLELEGAVAVAYFEMPQLGPQGQVGVQRSADLAGVYLANAPARVLVRPVSVVMFSWLDDAARDMWLNLVVNTYEGMQRQRVVQGAGLVLPGPGAKIPPFKGGH